MSKILFQDLLATLKRSNKERKLVLANKAGYKTVEEYKLYLENEISGKATGILRKSTKKTIAKEEIANLTDMVDNLPLGAITKLEILHFVLYHTQRHLHQMKKICDALK